MLLNLYCIAADRYWVASSPGDWNYTGNWSTTSGGTGGSSVPGSSDRAIFDGNGLGNCTIGSNANVLHFDVRNSFTDTIDQYSGYTITIASNGSASFSGGVFLGGNANITIAGTFTLDSGAVFRSTSATLAVRGDVLISDGNQFIHNNGLLSLYAISGGSVITANIDTLNVYNFLVDNTSGDKKVTFNSGNQITVLNDLTLSGSVTFHDIALFDGKIYVKNDIYVQYRRSIDYGQGTTEIIVDGSGTQLIDGTGNANGALFKLTIDKGSDTVKFKNRINIQNNFTYNSGIVIFESSSLIEFRYSSTIDGTYNFNKLRFNASTATTTWNINDTLTVNDTLSITGNIWPLFYSGIVNCKGNFDVSQNSTGSGGGLIGTTTFILNGTSDQYFIGKATKCFISLPVVVINKPSGTLYLSNHITIIGQLHNIRGTVNAGTSNIAFVRNCIITGEDLSLYNVTLFPPTSYSTSVSLADSTLLTINNTLFIDRSIYNNFASFYVGTIHCKGDIDINDTRYGGGGTYKIIINGTGDQHIYGSNFENGGFLSNVDIDKTSGTCYVHDILCLGGKWNLKNGTLDLLTYSSTLFFNTTGTTVIKGNQTLNNLTVYTNYGGRKFTISDGTTITINGDFKGMSSGSCEIDSGAIEFKGNFINATSLNGGSGTLKATGGNNQAFTGTTSLTTGELPNFIIDKSGGTFTVTDYLNVQKTLTLTSGIITTANGSSKVHLLDNSTVSGGSITSYVDGIVSKLGNDAFTFPIGENGLYRPLTITAPSSTAARFEAEYFNEEQTLGATIDTSFAAISDCEYWNLNRAVGTSTVQATLGWSENTCDIPGDTSTIGCVYWDGAAWSSISPDLITGNDGEGSLRLVTLITGNYSFLALALKKSNLYYALTQHKLDGTVYKTKNNRLYVKYNGEYNVSQLKFNIYNMSHTIVADQTDVGVVNASNQFYGDNRLTFNFSCSGFSMLPGFYILEIINEKNEKEYIRFEMLNDTSGC